MNETFVDKIEHINIAMPMYNLIEYSDNYSDTPGSLWQFKRDELNNDNINTALADNNAPSFKYKASIIGNTDVDGANSKKDDVKLAVPLKYLSNFWRSLEMPLINCKIELSLKWYENCILSSAGTAATFAITDTKLYVPVVTLKTEDNAKLSKLLNEGFKRSVYWNKYKIILKDYAENENIRERLDTSFQGVSKLLLLVNVVILIMLTKKHLINIYFQKLKLKTTTLKFMVEIFMIKQLMLQLNNMMK